MESEGFRSFSDLGVDDVVLMLEEPETFKWWEFNGSCSDHFERAAPEAIMPPLNKRLKTLAWNNSCKPDYDDEEAGYSYAPPPLILSYHQPFASQDSSPPHRICTKKNRHVHSVSERKRREKLAQGFLTLSTLLPPLNKGDKISILGDAIEYIKQLQLKVKALEDKRTVIEVFKLIKKYSGDDDKCCVEIEARFCDKEVLISIHCRKRKGILEKVVAEFDKFQLLVINSSSLTYGHSAFNITLIAERKDERTMSIKELVENLCGVL